MNRITRQGYVFSFSLTPKKTGTLRIPAIAVKVAGRTYQTEPIEIRVKKPEETRDFKLRLHLSKTDCYVGEPLELGVTWYIGRSVKGFHLSLPVLDDPTFEAVPLPDEVPADQQDQFLNIQLGQTTVLARKGRDVLDGQEYTTVGFKLGLIPKHTGTLVLPQATVQCQALAPVQRRGPADPSGGMFGDDDPFRDFFGQGRQESFETVVAPSNQPALTVSALPEEGRPVDFTGLVGEYGIAIQATPIEVNVGDPITLTIQVFGPSYLKNVGPPSLKNNPVLARDFKIPEEMSAGQIAGKIITFTQTIRPTHARVQEIPALEFAYFSPQTKKYETARSRPIALVVRPAREIRVEDAEGRTAGVKKIEIAEVEGGIAHNFEDAAVLEIREEETTRWPGSPGWLAFLVIPPAVYVVIFGCRFFVRNRRRDPEGLAARKAYEVLTKDLKRLDSSPVGDRAAWDRLSSVIRTYLGKKLRRAPGAITFIDVDGLLATRGVPAETLAELKVLLAQCEAHCYAGSTSEAEDLGTMLALARTVISEIERSLK